MRTKNYRVLIIKKVLLSCAIAGSFSVLAVQPRGINTTVTPLVNTSLKYDDNITNSAIKIGGSIVTLAPSLSFSLNSGVNSYQVDVTAESGLYSASPEDDYLNTQIDFLGHLEPSDRSRFDINAVINWSTEARGTGLTEGAGDTIVAPVNYNEKTLDVIYEYGALSSNAHVALNAKYYNKGYSEHKDITSNNDFNSWLVGATLSYSTNSRTDAVVEFTFEDIAYDQSTTSVTSRDSSSVNVGIGVEWQATPVTSVFILMGRQQKSFKNVSRQDFKGNTWNVELQWLPLSYSTVNFNASGQAKDSQLYGDYILSTTYSFNWSHSWNKRLSTNLDINLFDDKYYGFNRKDNTTSVNASVNYAVLRWFDVSFYGELTNKDSTVDSILFDKQVFGVNFTFSL